jgi:hypothetical protein
MIFHLTYRPLSSTMLLDRTFEAFGPDDAFTIAAGHIAALHGMAHEHVAFDSATLCVTIGAGYRSRRGTFTLQPVAIDAGDVTAAAEVGSLIE